MDQTSKNIIGLSLLMLYVLITILGGLFIAYLSGDLEDKSYIYEAFGKLDSLQTRAIELSGKRKKLFLDFELGSTSYDSFTNQVKITSADLYKYELAEKQAEIDAEIRKKEEIESTANDL